MSNHHVKWTVRKTADGWTGEATIAIAPGASVTARARGTSRGDAAARTFAALDAVTRSPLVASLLPPGAGAALQAARKVASFVSRLTRRRRRAGQQVSGAAVARALRARGLPDAMVRVGYACAS